jgi:hypothetical protein
MVIFVFAIEDNGLVCTATGMNLSIGNVAKIRINNFLSPIETT